MTSRYASAAGAPVRARNASLNASTEESLLELDEHHMSEPMHSSLHLNQSSRSAVDIESSIEFQRLEIQRLKSEIELAQLQLDLERMVAQPQTRTPTTVENAQGPSVARNKLSKLKTPRMEPEVYTGDLLKFSVWWRAFETLIEGATDCDRDRLFFLGKYTSGAAKEAIQCFLMSDGQDAYHRAKLALKRRFGDKLKASEVYRQELVAFPDIKQGVSISFLKLADFLDQCLEAMKCIQNMAFLDNPVELKKLLKKLPPKTGEAWSRKVDESL
jgi:hypothetical protein